MMDQSLPKLIVFTDLDGTLLEHDTYACHLVQSRVGDLVAANIPLVFCSSKTRAEQEYYRAALDVADPFIVENGSALVIPKDYFRFEFAFDWETEAFLIIELGMRYDDLNEIVTKAQQATGVELVRLEQLSPEEVREETGLPGLQAARRAKEREYSSTLLSGDFQSEAFKQFKGLLAPVGLQCTQGTRYLTITGSEADKGRATRMLLEFYGYKFGAVHSYGLGDASNDLPMLEAVDQGYLVQKPDGTWIETDNDRITREPGIGPLGWRAVVSRILGTEAGASAS
jgi:mannosyl-3-phosphoglycerate phosphatase